MGCKRRLICWSLLLSRFRFVCDFFGNVLGAFIIMELPKSILLIRILQLPAAFSLYFDLFDGILQAYIFVFLTAMYVQEAVEVE